MFLTWFTYILAIFPFGNLWQNHNKQMRYERSHKSLNSFSLVEYNKIYPSTNSWKTLQEESLWQVDFDNLYFWNTLNKTHQGILVRNKNIRLHTSNKISGVTTMYLPPYLCWCMSFFHLPFHVLFPFSLYTHVSYYLYAVYYFCFTQRCLDEFCLKCFKNTGCQSLLVMNTILAKFFKSLC